MWCNRYNINDGNISRTDKGLQQHGCNVKTIFFRDNWVVDNDNVGSFANFFERITLNKSESGTMKEERTKEKEKSFMLRRENGRASN